ncbi:ferredoxin reductase family protein [Nodularia spumigena]|uniref:ferredoxin reductase family protein n=1 Tax=Nodularia spumigena TaxID=70799 RepID=UPI002B21ABFE|nr:ferric reductase-like transmembrane domain-containing protein [Nodularia spumigena]MEA5557634.1 ferric reductase-like transmembrane domain-containing protein [Nodularia spumigena CH309]
MKLRLSHVAIALGAYTIAVLAPLAIVLLGPLPEGRGFWVELSVALGFIGLAMMGAQFALTARFRRISTLYGQDSLLQFHRQAGIVAVCLVLAHPVIAIIAEPAYLSFFDPRVNLPRAGALSFVTVVLILIVALSLFRKQVGLSYEWWRLTHGALGFFALTIGLAHVLMVGHYISPLWKQAVWIVMTAGAMVFLARMRILTPLIDRKRPWRVAEVRPECLGVWTLALEPDGHDGIRFLPGQFVWLTLADSPLSLQQHPFSIASSAESPARIELTIKALGDFTSTIGRVQPSARAFLEGPYGGFALHDDAPCDGLVFIVGGIGITPAMSMLRTLRDRGAGRPITLVYGAPSEADIVFRGELEAMVHEMNLRLTLVVEKPDEGWKGERGLIDDGVLDRSLPEDSEHTHYFICGPAPMMDAVEKSLLGRGAPLGRIHSERFNIV